MTAIRWTDWRGKEQCREVNETIRVEDFKDTPGYSLLLMAANTHLCVEHLVRLCEAKGVERGRKWISNRRRLFQQPGTVNPSGPRPNADGRDAQAIALMRENTTLSLRDMVRLLKKNGIDRSREWVRWRRCD